MFAKLVSAVIGILVCSALSFGARAELLPGSYLIASDAPGGVLNMRSGPGQGHSIVVAVPAGSGGVTIDQCRSPDDGKSRYDWCQAKWNGYSGWVSSSGIVRDSSRQRTDSADRMGNNDCGAPILYDQGGGVCDPVQEDLKDAVGICEKLRREPYCSPAAIAHKSALENCRRSRQAAIVMCFRGEITPAERLTAFLLLDTGSSHDQTMSLVQGARR